MVCWHVVVFMSVKYHGWFLKPYLIYEYTNNIFRLIGNYGSANLTDYLDIDSKYA